MSVNLVASNYGMNFERIPELGWPYGYAWALGLMVAVGAVLTFVFRRIDWLYRGLQAAPDLGSGIVSSD